MWGMSSAAQLGTSGTWLITPDFTFPDLDREGKAAQWRGPNQFLLQAVSESARAVLFQTCSGDRLRV